MKPLQIGITGGIGSGKSLVCRIFSCFGVPVYDADSRAKALMNSDPVLTANIKKEFGEPSYEGGNLNRAFLAANVFSDPVKLGKLNALVHPAVATDYANWVQAQENGVPYVLKEAALLFETGSYKQLHKVILITSPKDIRIRRISNRDRHRTVQQISEIIENQWSDEQKIDLADYVIKNDESELLIPQVIALHQVFRTLVQ